jgi:hypothetical protein
MGRLATFGSTWFGEVCPSKSSHRISRQPRPHSPSETDADMRDDLTIEQCRDALRKRYFAAEDPDRSILNTLFRQVLYYPDAENKPGLRQSMRWMMAEIERRGIQ